eukprot:4314224-Pyramimonas_sp.AAC.1
MSVARAAELGQPGKTGEMDHAVVLDLPRQQALAWALARLRETRLGAWHPLRSRLRGPAVQQARSTASGTAAPATTA